MVAAKLANMNVGGDGSNQFGNTANLRNSEISQAEAAKMPMPKKPIMGANQQILSYIFLLPCNCVT